MGELRVPGEGKDPGSSGQSASGCRGFSGELNLIPTGGDNRIPPLRELRSGIIQLDLSGGPEAGRVLCGGAGGLGAAPDADTGGGEGAAGQVGEGGEKEGVKGGTAGPCKACC